jgi:hypothetical protein
MTSMESWALEDITGHLTLHWVDTLGRNEVMLVTMRGSIRDVHYAQLIGFLNLHVFTILN